MTAPVRVACPHCQAGLKLRSREYLERTITCPGCKQSFVPEPERAFDMLDVVEDEPEDSTVQSPPEWKSAEARMVRNPTNKPAPKAFSPPRTDREATPLREEDFELEQSRDFERRPAARSSKDRGKRMRFPWRPVVIGCTVLILALGLFLIPWRSFAPRAGDTPEELARQLSVELEQMETTLASLRTGRNRDDVLADLKKHEERIQETYRRSVRVKPLMGADSFERMAKLQPTLNQASERRTSVFIQLSAAGMNDPQFSSMATQVEMNATGVARYLGGGLREVPAPQNEPERIQVEWLELQRNVLIAISRLERPGDFGRAAGEFTIQKSKLDLLTARIKTLGGADLSNYAAAEQKYRDWQSFIDNEIALLERSISLRHGYNEEFQRAYASYRTARNDVMYAHLGKVNGGQPEVAGDFPFGPPGFPPRFVPGNIPGPQGFGGPPVVPPGLPPGGFGRFPQGPPNFGPPAGMPNLPASVDEFAQNFMKQHGKEKTVILLVPGEVLSNEQQQSISAQMAATFGQIRASSSFSGGSTNSTMFAYTIEGDLKQIAERIKFATVTAIDFPNRRITLEAPR